VRYERTFLRTLILLLSLLTAFIAAAADKTYKVTFDEVPPHEPHEPKAVKIGMANFEGGKPIYIRNDTASGTDNCYWSAPSYGGTLRFARSFTITFDKPASDIEFDLANGVGAGEAVSNDNAVTYFVRDDQGHTISMRLPAFDQYKNLGAHIKRVKFPHDNVRRLDILPNWNTDTGGYWNFSIDNFEYTVPEPRPERMAAWLDGEPTAVTLQLGDGEAVLQVPLGSRFVLRLERRDLKTGEWKKIQSKWEVRNNLIAPAQPLPAFLGRGKIAPPLYPDTVAFGFSEKVPHDTKMFQTLHYGTAVVQATPSDLPPGALEQSITVEVSRPPTLGPVGILPRTGLPNPTQFDARLAALAHKSGLPPQYLKGQIEQETFDSVDNYFNPRAWRYEPMSVDYRRGSKASTWYLRTKAAFIDYALPNGKKLCRQATAATTDCAAFPATPNCPSDLDDWVARNELQICDRVHHTDGQREPIESCDQLTVRDIVFASPRQNWINKEFPDPSPQIIPDCGDPMPDPPSNNPPDKLGYPAQTPLASSYGLLQLLPIFIIYEDNPFNGAPYYWEGNGGRYNPSLIFDTEENFRRQEAAEAAGKPRAGAGSLYLGVTKDVYLHRDMNSVKAAPVFADRDAFEATLSVGFHAYTGGGIKDYGKHVIAYAQSYEPQRKAGSIWKIGPSSGCDDPVIVSQPSQITVESGHSAVIRVEVEADPAAMFDWYTGTESSPVFLGVTDSDNFVVTPSANATYWVEVSNVCGKATSAPISVVVTPACPLPAVTGPASIVSSTDVQATLSVSTNGSSLVYDWFILPDGADSAITDVPDGTIVQSSASPTFVARRGSNPVTYAVRVRNACGAIISGPVVVGASTCVPARVEQSPVPRVVYEDDPVSMSVIASGSAPLQVQWFRGPAGDEALSTRITDATSATYSFVARKTGLYWAKVSNACGTDASNAALLTVIPRCLPPFDPHLVWSGNPVNEGGGVPLSVTVDGTGPFNYHWYEKRPDEQTPRLISWTSSDITVYPEADGTMYYPVVFNDCGQVSPTPIFVRVLCTHPAIPQPLAAPTFTSEADSQPLTVAATGPNLHYQWFRDDVDLHIDAQSILLSASAPAATYHVRVFNTCGTVTSDSVTVQPFCAPPAIQGALTAPSFTSGNDVQPLTVSATGTRLHYQWFRDGVGTGFDSPTLPVSPPATSTSYWVRVYNDCGERFSNVVHIDPLPECVAPVIPTPLVAPVFTSATETKSLTVSAGGTDLHYQWFRDGVATGPDSDTIPVSAPSSPTTFSVRVYNTCGERLSNTVTVQPPLPVCDAPVIHAPLVAPVFTSATETKSLTVSAGGTDLHYQWFRDGVAAGADSNTIPVPAPSSSTTYSVRVYNTCGEALSDAVTVQPPPVCDAPRVTTWTGDVTIPLGGSTTLAVSAAGTQPLSYQWYGRDPAAGDFARIDGETAPFITVAPSTTSDYYAAISNACGTTSSPPVRVTVQQPPPPCTAASVTEHPQGGTIARGTVVPVHAAATGTELHVQWYEYLPELGREYAMVNGANVWSITVQPHASGYYVFARVWNDCSDVRSDNAVFTLSD
jgi:hypothetical protein